MDVDGTFEAVSSLLRPNATSTNAPRAGLAVCLLAEAFPNSEVHGYDISHL
jgi:hypothetical protein